VYESYTQDPLCQAAEAAWKAGIVVVAAAGNDGRDNSYNNQGYGTITAPGNDPYVITVGAMKTEGTYTRTDDLVASYSSKGPTAVDHVVKPDLVAPGNLIVSLQAAGATLVKQNSGNLVTKSYFEEASHGPVNGTSTNFFILSGTSMAAAVVSGAVADIVHANPALTPDQVKILLMQTASKTFPTSSSVTDTTSGLIYTDYYDIFTVGAGYLDLGAAMSGIHTVPAAGTAMSPIAIYDPNTTNVSLSYDISSVFTFAGLRGTQAIWGAPAIWAPSQVSANKCLWGASGDTASKCLWGAAADTASKCLWGASAVSSASANESSAESVSVGGEQ
jgi:serine protease AprX